MTIIVRGFLGPFTITNGYASSTFTPLVVFVDARAAQLVRSASDADPFGVDPRAAQVVYAASDADPFGVDPRGAQLVRSASDADPFGVDPRSAKQVS
jgi:hypothetical protein